ncbi:DeoR family transcriptional regulator [Tepidamorphus gemmatus]|uniref:DeoR family transcriptional regulator n=1 Tax=Tepidamorphus gemmatus TaxID=747076 RepID=A0A4R3MH70_9HYPH|nr:DeoR family transcriptional regulator [Tepidamorphus gemmatus]TCT11719.1 DeoR family transcriptional regulator [Tepidamorphus gemmatus]
MLIPRQKSILELARQVGRVTVEDLAARFEVTPQTIRKDLNDLCDKRLLTRVHGGAILSSGVQNVGYDARRMMAMEAKAAIGQATAALIPDSASLFINIGTTTEAVARAMLQHDGLMVITNNLNVASLMRGYSQIEVVIAGGVVRHADGGIVGEAAVDFIRQFKVDFAVIGVSAIDADGALLDFDYREVRVAQAIISNARHVILVSDATKFERSAPVRIGHLSQVQTFVTDVCRPAAIRRICAEANVRLIETGDPAATT